MTSNDTPLREQPHEHRQVWDAIAWVAAGTATAEQQRLVEDHLPHCAHCRDELALQRRLYAGMQDDPAETVDEDAIRAGLDRLWAHDREAGPLQPVEAARGRAANEGSRTTRWLTAAVAAQAVALCVLGLRLWPADRAGGASGAGADYVTLSQPAALPAGAAVRLVPQERTDMAQLRQLLSRHGLRIVGADDDASSLLLAPASHGAGVSPTELAQRLRAEPGVLLAEPVGTDAAGR